MHLGQGIVKSGVLYWGLGQNTICTQVNISANPSQASHQQSVILQKDMANSKNICLAVEHELIDADG